jgi:hypothetical protein
MTEPETKVSIAAQVSIVSSSLRGQEPAAQVGFDARFLAQEISTGKRLRGALSRFGLLAESHLPFETD